MDLADAADGEAELAYLGAGPVEDLLSHCGPDFALPVLDDLEAAVRRSPPLRVALESVIPHEKSVPRIRVFMAKYAWSTGAGTA